MDKKNQQDMTFKELVLQKTEDTEPLSKEQLCNSLAHIIDPSIGDKVDFEVFISNYVFITSKVKRDLVEINNRLSELKSLNNTIPINEDYAHKKIYYFSTINRQARDEVLEFLNTGLVKFLKEHKTVNFLSRQNDEGLLLYLKSFYEYGYFKRYYDYYYDFSTEAKIRFIHSPSLIESFEQIDKYIKLKATDMQEYGEVISRMIFDNDILNYLQQRIDVHNIMNKRLEVFETLKTLYTKKKWQPFISLALLQIEGLFYDCCEALGFQSANAGTLVEKVDKSFKDNRVIMLSVYPYYKFEIPMLRNEIAHTGLLQRDDLELIANELVLDLNTVISWIYDITHSKYTHIKIMYDNLKECINNGGNIYDAIMSDMLINMGLTDYKYLDLIKCPNKFTLEMQFMKTPQSYWEEKLQKLLEIIKSEDFWNILNQHIADDEKYNPDKRAFNPVMLADKLVKTFIMDLLQDSPEKKACQRVAAKIQRCKANSSGGKHE